MRILGRTETAYDEDTHTFAVASTGRTDITVTSEYDARGRAIAAGIIPRPSDSSSEIAISEREYDGLDRLTGVQTLPGSGIDASFSYSDAGRLLSVTDPLGRVTTLSYDAAGRVTGVISPEGVKTKTAYDGFGRVKTTYAPSTDGTPTVTASCVAYDGLGRVEETSYFDAQGELYATVTPSYDEVSRVTSTVLSGEVTGTASATYDDLDRVTLAQTTGPAGSTETSVTYDVADLPTAIDYTAFGGSFSVANVWAKTGQLRTSTALGETWAFGFGSEGALTSVFSDSALLTRSHDVSGRLLSVRAGTRTSPSSAFSDLFQSSLTYDARDRIASVSLASSEVGGYTDSYAYDDANRLTSWTRSGDDATSATYEWDDAGNLQTKTQGGVTTAFEFDSDNRLTSAVTGSAATTYTSDAYGRRTAAYSSTEGTTTYTWDALGHLTQIASEEATCTYEYGISGMREKVTVETTAATTWTKSVWSGQQLVSELDSDGTLYRYVWGPGRTPLAVEVTVQGGQPSLYSYHTDAAGFVVAITDADGSVAASYRYDAFGDVTHVGGSDPTLAERNPLRYRSYYHDSATGLYYLPARYYEPESARFLSREP